MAEYLDTRDLNTRLEELESDSYHHWLRILNLYVERVKAKEALDEWNDKNSEELKELQAMSNEVSEWIHGNTLIPESSFIDYIKDMLEDTGDIPKNLPFYIVIDWETTADNLKADYSEINYQGETYLYRVS